MENLCQQSLCLPSPKEIVDFVIDPRFDPEK
jgi:hypothetical protein